MPAADTIALVARYLDAHNRGDAGAMLACLSDDVVHDANQGMRRAGKAAFADFCRHMARCYEERFEDIVIMTSPDGARAAAEFNVTGTYLETDPGLPPAKGQAYRLPGALFFAIRDGRIARVTSYFNLTEWLTQVIGDDGG
jgi:steroid delta-isomerase-like uncharacterized protein